MSTEVAQRLTATETLLFAECETVIERGMGVFVEVGEALMQVRDRRLYRADFATFEDYCRERWSLSTTHAYNLIDAAKVTELISSAIADEINLPATESQARELAPLLDDPEKLREVWAEANARTNGKPTAAAIREVREERERESVPFTGKIERIEPGPWSDNERHLRERVEQGFAVVASLRGQHANLIAWAEDAGLFVRVDRRSEWGNPFELPDDGDRDTVIGNYARYYLPNKPSLLSKLHSLRGKVLGCWCAPEACHGDVLIASMDSSC